MKKTKVIIPALGMLLLSTAASVTGTVAWFTANKTVTASGMQIKAKAEDGIVINNDVCADNNWKTTTTASHTGVDLALNPTSTADGSTWYHATSDDMNNKDAAGDYETLSIAVPEDASKAVGATTGGIGYVDSNDNEKYDVDTESAYYLLNNFYIKSSGVELTNQTFYINKVNAKVAGENPTTNSEDLNKALRVLVKVGADDAFIVAPFDGATVSYNVKGTEAVTANYAANGVYDHETSVTTIPANTTTKDNCIKVSCYAYFEGEDVNCKSVNITATLDALSVDFAFGLKALAA